MFGFLEPYFHPWSHLCGVICCWLICSWRPWLFKGKKAGSHGNNAEQQKGRRVGHSFTSSFRFAWRFQGPSNHPKSDVAIGSRCFSSAKGPYLPKKSLRNERPQRSGVPSRYTCWFPEWFGEFWGWIYWRVVQCFSIPHDLTGPIWAPWAVCVLIPTSTWNLQTVDFGRVLAVQSL